MPHVIVKLYAGRSDRQKAKLAEEVTKAVMASVNCGEDSVSVRIEDIRPNDWTEKVFKPDIIGKWDSLYKKPGHSSV
jgi:4-oxalocrotonate tautomerase